MYPNVVTTEASDLSKVYGTNPNASLPFMTEPNESPRNKAKGIITFEKYSPRKDIFKTSEVPILTYLEPTDLMKDQKKIVDFNKMKARNFNFEVASTNPSVSYYNPNYDYLNKNVASIPLGKSKDKGNSKFMMIQKLWRSYNVQSDYRTVPLKTSIQNEQ